MLNHLHNYFFLLLLFYRIKFWFLVVMCVLSLHVAILR